MMELLKTPTWLKGRTDMPEDEKFEPPPIATLPEPAPAPPPSEADGNDSTDPGVIIGQARLLVNQFRASQAADKRQIEQLRVELAETTLMLESEKRKSEMLEADVAERDTTIQGLETEAQGYRQTFQGIRQRLDQHGIEPPEKNGKRNGNSNKKKP